MGPAAAGTRAKVNSCITKIDTSECYTYSPLNDQARDKSEYEFELFVRIQRAATTT